MQYFLRGETIRLHVVLSHTTRNNRFRHFQRTFWKIFHNKNRRVNDVQVIYRSWLFNDWQTLKRCVARTRERSTKYYRNAPIHREAQVAKHLDNHQEINLQSRMFSKLCDWLGSEHSRLLLDAYVRLQSRGKTVETRVWTARGAFTFFHAQNPVQAWLVAVAVGGFVKDL